MRKILITLGTSSLIASFCLTATSAQAISAQEAISDVNQQRAANGIPPLSLDQSLLRPECSLENHHIASAATSGWSATTSPWNSAPVHQSLLYDPNATAASYGEYSEFRSNNPSFPSSPGPWACMWFSWNSEASAPAPTFYSFVSTRGPSSVPATETAAEWPATPGALVGLAQGSETGPNLLVYALGLGENPHIVSASLTSVSGQAEEVRTVDGTTPYEGRTLMFPGRGDLIPVKPLAYNTAYTATLTWEGDGTQSTQTFSFTTEPAAQEEPEGATSSAHKHPVSLRIARVAHRKHSLRLSLKASSVLYGRRVALTVRYLKPTHCAYVNDHILSCASVRVLSRHTSSLTLGHNTVPVTAKAGELEISLRSEAFTRDGVEYAAASTTRRIKN